jgi:hypothetical protein
MIYVFERQTLSMIESYRKAAGSNVWHFCSNCTTYPAENYISFRVPLRVENPELCTECLARHEVGDCETDGDSSFIGRKKCPVFVGDQECGLDLIQDLATGFHLCSSGHRSLIVPPVRPKKSN